MKKQLFIIYVDRLRHGEVEKIAGAFPATFFDVEEEALRYEGNFQVEGEAYLADQTLIIQLEIKALAVIPCSICNEPIQFLVHVPYFYHTVPMDEVKGAIFDYGDLVRESVLLETPQVVECHQGKCPQRKLIEKYFKNDEGYQPFAKEL